MNYRVLGKTEYRVSEISLGTWQLGSKWGEAFNEANALATLEQAVAAGINFFDTADIYQGGASEQTIGRFLKTQKERIYVTTKCGRKLAEHTAAGYNRSNITAFAEASLRNMQLDCLDLLLLHCPPTDVYYQKEAFEALDLLKAQGKIRHYGVSVERIEEAIKALDYDISAVEIIFNMFRQKPAELFFPLARQRQVGIIVRVPLASGLLTGKFTENTSFNAADHRHFNRHGEAFDQGETFAGVDYAVGVRAAQELHRSLGIDIPLAWLALRYILMFDAVSTVIPGASTPEQIRANAAAAELAPLTEAQMQVVREIYEREIKAAVHYRW